MNSVRPSKLSSDLARGQIFIRRRRLLSQMSYALLRKIELCSAWLISSSDTDWKVTLGDALGHSSMYLGLINDRLLTLLLSQHQPSSHKSLSSYFDGAVFFTKISEQADYLAGVDEWLVGQIDAYLDEPYHVEDGPSYPLLKSVREYLRDQIQQTNSTKPNSKILSATDDELVDYSGAEPLPVVPNWPGRPPGVIFNDNAGLRHKSYRDLVANPEYLKHFCHYVMLDIEIAAMEVCAKNIISYRSMPLEFKLDMARQIWDEARHARLMKKTLSDLGAKEGDFSYNAKVWTKSEKGRDLAERLAIQQVFQEGNALESNFVLTDVLAEAGLNKLVVIFDYINADEALHVQIGNRWLRYLTGNDNKKYLDTIQRSCDLLGISLSGNVDVNVAARQLTGFPDDATKLIDSNNRSFGLRKAR